MEHAATLSPLGAPEGDAGAQVRRAVPPPISQQIWAIDVLLVEDDEADRALILDVLKRNADVRSVQATDAPDKILFDLATGRCRPDLILLDIHMPKVNGFRFLEALRNVPAMRATPVVLLTTSRLARDVAEARASSAALYVVKPDTYEELQARLGGVVKQAVSGVWSKPYDRR